MSEKDIEKIWRFLGILYYTDIITGEEDIPYYSNLYARCVRFYD